MFVELHQLQIFGDCPLLLVEVWVYVVVPSLSALLADPARQIGSYLLPLLQAVLCHLLFQDHVFFGCPVTFDLLDSAILGVVAEEKPSVHALDLCLELAQ